MLLELIAQVLSAARELVERAYSMMPCPQQVSNDTHGFKVA